MPDKSTGDRGRARSRQSRQEILAEQVKHVYSVAPFGIAASVINSLIVFFIMDNVMPYRMLVIWLAAITAASIIRTIFVLRFRSVAQGPFPAGLWKNLFLASLALTGIVWGSIALIPDGASLAHEVFLAFVLGGMSAGAASTFSVLKDGYLAYSVPALVPLVVRFIIIPDMFHLAMAGMITLYGVLLWRISRYHYRVNRISLLLRFENADMIESLKSAKENLERMYHSLSAEVRAKLKAETELRAHQDRLERTVHERTADLTRANSQLKTEIGNGSRSRRRFAKAGSAWPLPRKRDG